MVLPAIAAAAATGFGSAAGQGLFSSIFGGGAPQQPSSITNWSTTLPAYSAQMGALQSQITTAQQGAALAQGAEVGALGAEAKLFGEAGLAGYQKKLAEGAAARGLETGVAAQYAELVTGLEGKTGEAKLALALTPAETERSLTETYGKAVGEIGKETAGKLGDIGTQTLAGGATILGQGTAGVGKALDSASLGQLYGKITEGVLEGGKSTVAGQNQAVANVLSSNLRIAEQQEASRNRIAEQMANVEGQLALKRFGRGAALAGKASIA